MRTLIHYACLAGFVVCIAGSYCLADIANDAGLLAPSNIGWATSFQYLFAGMFMLGVWLTTRSNDGFRQYRWILLAGIIVRLILIPVDSYTSNDTDRYLWDGIVAAEGHDPYRISANNPQVAYLRHDWPTPPEHAHYATLYPPLAVASFAVVAMAGPEYAAVLWKCLATLAGLITLLLAVPLLRNANKLQHFALIALSPILVLETGIGAHLDAFSVLAITAALLAWQHNKYVLLGILIGIGTLFKLLPIILLLPLVVYLRLSHASLRMLGSAIVTLIAGYGGALLIGWQPIGILATFFEKWRFGSPVFSALESIFSGMGLSFVIAALLIVGLVITAFIAKTKPLSGMQWALSIPLILSPVVFPWYLSILVPLVALAPSAFLIGWLCVMPLTYEVLNGFIGNGTWEPAQWPLILVVITWIFGVVWDRYSSQATLTASRNI